MDSAILRFYDDLNDFLPQKIRGRDFTVGLQIRQSVKDIIEAVGPPHCEVGLILINGHSAGFGELPSANDQISVYPYFSKFDITLVSKVAIPMPGRPNFIADVNLGRLAVYLRLLGFDTLYSNDLEDSEITEIASESGRIVLSRDIGLLKRSAIGLGRWLRSDKPVEQLRETLRKFNLFDEIREFTLCSECNSPLRTIAKSEIEHLLEEGTRRNFNDFFECSGCGKIYWKGSHYKRFMNFLNEIHTEDSSV
ncbi:MAG: Mut7-C RNAse domain-containing protein [Candidatus Kapaibacterium sp.]